MVVQVLHSERGHGAGSTEGAEQALIGQQLVAAVSVPVEDGAVRVGFSVNRPNDVAGIVYGAGHAGTEPRRQRQHGHLAGLYIPQGGALRARRRWCDKTHCDAGVVDIPTGGGVVRGRVQQPRLVVARFPHEGSPPR